MPNMNDYLLWRGDLSLEAAPWNNIDSLIMANLCYNRLSNPMAATADGITLSEMAPTLDLPSQTGNVYFEMWRKLLYNMAATKRFGSIVIHDYVDVLDEGRDLQFSALTARLEDGTEFIAYRGTDSTIAGWHEDFDMSFKSPVSAQTEAVRYLENIADTCSGGIRLSGHSKGGNLAAYAGAFCRQNVQDRLISACSFDGPGLSDEALESEGYKRLLPKLLSVIPQTSVVGLLMGYHTDYTVVCSVNKGILQHDSFSWQLNGPDFQRAEGIDDTSSAISDGLHAWLKNCTDEQRGVFVNAMFDLLEATDAHTTGELSEHKLKSASAMLDAMRKMDPPTRKAVMMVSRQLVTDTSAAAFEHLQKRSNEFFDSIQEKLPVIERPDLQKHSSDLISSVQELEEKLELAGIEFAEKLPLHGILSKDKPEDMNKPAQLPVLPGKKPEA